MTAALTPELAIAYVHELSADVRAVIVLDAQGRRLAGPGAAEGAANTVIAALGDAGRAAVRVPEGVVVAARTDTHALVAVSGPLALEGPTQLDAVAAVAAMGAGGSRPSLQSEAAARPSEALEQAAADVISALERPS